MNLCLLACVPNQQQHLCKYFHFHTRKQPNLPTKIDANNKPPLSTIRLSQQGLIVSVILAGKVGSILGAESQNEAMNMGYKIFAAGLCCGLSCLGSGFAIGITGDAGVRGVGQQGKLYVGLVLIQIFSEALGLYGFIVSLVLAA